jgi:uncharacterized protein YfdQ (DUF2303 family)
MFDIEKVLNALRAGQPRIDGVSTEEVPDAFAFVPGANGAMSLVSLKKFHDEWRDAPERASGVATALTLASFIDLVNRHKDDDSAVFADVVSDTPTLLAVIDYRRKTGGPRFQQHRVAYAYPVAKEWMTWLDGDGKKMTQSDFAAFIEEHIHEIGEPADLPDRDSIEALFRAKIADAAELFTLSRGLEISASISVKEVRYLASGQAQVAFEETHNDGSGSPLKVPGLFVVNVPFFAGQAPAPVLARLRYRLSSGKVTWHYELWRWQESRANRLKGDLQLVSEQTALDLFEGKPE